MKKLLILVLFIPLLVSCTENPVDLECNTGESLVDGICVLDEEPITCSDGYELVNDECKLIEEEPETCEEGYQLIGDDCILMNNTTTCEAGYELIGGECFLIEEPLNCAYPYQEINDECVIGTVPLSTFTLNELESDYDLFIDTILTNNPLTFTDRDEFISLSSTMRERLYEGMTEIEFYRIIAELISFINCSHSGVWLGDSSGYTFGRTYYFLPIDVEYQNDKLYIVEDQSDIGIPLGSEILSINGVNINDIIEEMYTMIPADGLNETLKKLRINDEFYYYYTLLYDLSPEYEITYIDISTLEEETISIYGVKESFADFYVTNYNYGNGLSYYIEDNYVYLRIPNFNTNGSYTVEGYEAYFSAFFTEVNELEIENLIIDIRHNNGGFPDVANILLGYLADNPFQYFSDDVPPAFPHLQEDTLVNENNYTGEVYVIADGGSLSTSGHFLALFQYHEMGYIVGEESGAGYTCTDASFNTRLPNTNITFRTSSIKWNVDVLDNEVYTGIFPDYEHTPSIDDVINRNDSTLQYIIDLINEIS